MSDAADDDRRWQRRALFAAGTLGALAVAAGAFGAHALEQRLSARMLEVWATAARYHMWHVLALLALGVATPLWRWRATRIAGACWVAGIVLFSGSLYLLALTGVGVLGAVTPFGGVAFIAGWMAIAIGAARAR